MTSRTIFRTGIAAVLTLALYAPHASAEGDAIATYGETTFTTEDFNAALEQVSPRARKTLDDIDRRRKFVENTILSDLIFEKGRSQGIADSEEVKDQLKQLERRLVIQAVMAEQQAVPIPDEDIRAYYDAHPQEFSTERLKASHILVNEEELARELHAKVTADPSKFGELAGEHSVDKSNAKRGGDLGFFGKNRMVKEFEEAAFALPEDGAISEPIKTRFGWHIIQRTTYDGGKIKEFAEVESQIRVRLVNERRGAVTQEFLDGLKESAKLTINEEALAAVVIPSRSKDGDDKPDPHAGH